jgi:hypothetical protein
MVAQFIPVMTTYSGPELAELYSSRTVCFHEVSKWLVSAIEEPKLFRSSGKGCMKPWIPNGTSVLLITLRPMDNRESKLDS